jgi:exopolysaccharide biosynthesis polyprenyl glycosylphosphotransferase
MATSEYLRKNGPPTKQPTQFGAQPATPQSRVAGPGLASKLLLMLGDVFIVTLAFGIALLIKLKFFQNFGDFKPMSFSQMPFYFAFFAWFLLALLLVSHRYGLYNPFPVTSGTHEMRLTVQAVLNAGLLLCGGLYMTHWNIVSRSLVILLISSTVIVLSLWRATRRLSRYRYYEKGINTRNVVVLGTNYLSHAVGQHISGNYRLGYQFLGYIAPSASDNDTVIGHSQVLGSVERLRQLTRLHFIDEVVIAQAVPTDQVIELLEEARELGVDIRSISGLYGDLTANAMIEYLGVYPVASLHRSKSRIFELFFKRAFDLLFSISALTAIFPILFIIAIAVRLDSPGPIFYVSERIGKRGRVFPCFKFRTMVKDAEKRKKELAALNERDGILFKMANDPRITRVGRFLRKYSLDELPQLFNVLRGEMSLVGPRPPIASEVEKYELEHFRRLEVTPGLTGLWQVHARQDGSFAKYIELDTAYVENWSFWLDVKILVRTAHVVVRGTGT